MNRFKPDQIVQGTGRSESNGIELDADYVVVSDNDSTSNGTDRLVAIKRVDGQLHKGQTTWSCCAHRLKLKVNPFKTGDVLIVVDARTCAHLKVDDEVNVIDTTIQSVKILNRAGREFFYAATRFKLKDVPAAVTTGERQRAWPGQWLKGETLIAVETSYGLTQGKEYTVDEDMTGNQNVYIRNDYNKRAGLFPHRFKLKETETMATNIAPTAAQAGDIVLVEGTLTRGPDGEGDFAILFEGKTDNQFVPAKAIRSIVKRPPPEPKFKLEDRVRMDPSNVNFDRYKRGTIKGHDNGTYFVKWDSEGYSTVVEKNLRAA